MYNSYVSTRHLKLGFLFGKRIDDEKIQKHLERLGYTYRVVEVDYIQYIVTDDFGVNRLDIRLKNNKIIGF